LAQANSAKFTAVDAYADIVGAQKQNGHAAMEPEEGTEEAWGAEDVGRKDREPSECIVDVREYDINYYLRVAIDLGKLPGPSSESFSW
jgi:DNA polymerase epsilon subunit 1